MPLLNKDLGFLLAFSRINSVGPVTLQRLFNYFKSFENAWRSPTTELEQVKLPKNVIEQIIETRKNIEPEKYLIELEKENINVITILDKIYPKLLKQIYQPPFLLYYQGNLNLPETNLTVVGSRKHSFYGQQVIEKLLNPLTNQPLGIISGLAIGIDSLAHLSALKNNLPTIAVIGSGLSRSILYPKQNKNLADKIIKNNGCLISELPPNQMAQAPFFPRRNRILAGLAQATLIIEADITSGALITAKHALEFNREVLAVPGSIFNQKSVGPNWLLSQGAKTITKPEDLLEALNLPITEVLTEQIINFPSPLAEQIYKYLKQEINSIDQLTNSITSASPTDILVSLSSLEMANLIKKDGANYYVA